MPKPSLQIPIAAPFIAVLLCLTAACRSAAPAPGAYTPPEGEAAAPAENEAYQNTIKWSTASEVDNFGFDVYRGLSSEGPFERLNENPIEGGGTTDEPQYYRYVDDTIDPHETYYYYVESISMSGLRERFTPVGKASPKIPPTDGGDTP